jgi:hypothetical protein
MGMGYAGTTNFWGYWQAGFHFSPGAGYKMYIGERGPICFVPGFALDLIFGRGGSRSYKYANKNSFVSFRLNAIFLYSFWICGNKIYKGDMNDNGECLV